MILSLIDDFRQAIKALQGASASPGATRRELEAEVCRRSRLLAYDTLAALELYPGLVGVMQVREITSLFDEAIRTLGESDYARNVKLRRKEILAAAKQRDAEQNEFSARMRAAVG